MFKPVGDATKETFVAEDSIAPVAATGFLAKFTVLKGAERELWLTFLIKLLIISAYSITNKTLILWLSSDLGFSDQAAGALIGWVWAPAMTVFTLLAGSLTDALGLRRTFFLGVIICLVARSIMVFTTIPWLALAGGLFPLVIGEALGTPVLIAAARRYSTTRQRSISFSMIYMVMNVGYLIAGTIFDYVRHSLGEYGYLNLLGLHITTYRTLFLASLGFEVLLFPTIYFLRRGAEATDEGIRFNAEPVRHATGALWNRIWLTGRDSAIDTVALFKRLLGQSGFYRLLAFLLLIGFLKLIFLHIDLLNWRSFLFAARIRVCRRHSSQGPGGFLWRPLLHSIPYRKTPRWNRRLVASCLLPSTRSTKLRADVADLCAGGIDCADWIGCAAALHSRARGGT